MLKKRMNLALSLFFMALIWPLIHLHLTLQGSFCPWRFAGWGMYSIPYPDTFSSLQLVLCEQNFFECIQIAKNRISTQESFIKEVPIFEIFAFSKEKKLQSISLSKDDRDFFSPYITNIFQLAPVPHLQELGEKVLDWINGWPKSKLKTIGKRSSLLAIISTQRLNVKKGRLYLEYKFYSLQERPQLGSQVKVMIVNRL